jgi:hypothetical protein
MCEYDESVTFFLLETERSEFVLWYQGKDFRIMNWMILIQTNQEVKP